MFCAYCWKIRARVSRKFVFARSLKKSARLSRSFLRVSPQEMRDCLTEFLGAFLKKRANVSGNFWARSRRKAQLSRGFFGGVPEETRGCLEEFLGAFLKKRASGWRNFWARS